MVIYYIFFSASIVLLLMVENARLRRRQLQQVEPTYIISRPQGQIEQSGSPTMGFLVFILLVAVAYIYLVRPGSTVTELEPEIIEQVPVAAPDRKADPGKSAAAPRDDLADWAFE